MSETPQEYGPGWQDQEASGSNAMQSNAPMPRRAPPIQGHWAEKTEMSYQVDSQNDSLLDNEDDFTPRSETQYSKASSVPSAAPEFYEEEPVTLSRVQEVLAIEHGLREACKTIPITTASWVFFILLIFFHGEVQGSFDCANTVKQSMLAIQVPAVNSSVTLRELRIGTITERYDILQWLQKGLVPAVTMPGLKHGQLRRTQQMLGKVSVSQIRSVPVTCDMNPSLKIFHPGDCHPPGGVPQAYGTTKLDYKMAFEPYTLGVNRERKFVAWLDIGRPLATLDEQFQSMLDYNWLDDNTQEVRVEAMFLNPELNVYSKMNIIFKLSRGGWIQQDIYVQPMRGDVHYHWAVIWLDVMWVTVMLFLMWQATLHFMEELKHGLFWYWLSDLFVVFDILSVFAALGMAIFYWYIAGATDKYVQRVSALGTLPEQNGIEAAIAWKTRYILQNFNYESDVQGIFDDFDTVSKLNEWHRIVALMYSLVIVCRFYRGFTGQPRIAVILQTVSQVAVFMFHYLIVFVVVMANFTVSGYILFGSHIKDWSSLGKATASAFLMLFGRFDYAEFHSVAPISAVLWFGSFFILVCMVFTGMTTATILHHYLAVRAKTSEAGISIVKQLWQMFSAACYNRTYDGSQKSIPHDKLFEMVNLDTHPLKLRHLGRSNIDRRLRTRDDLHQAEIDPKVDAEFFIGRGMDPVTAERLLERIAESGHHIEMRSSPAQRLSLFIARQMTMLRFGAEHMRKKTIAKVVWASKTVDRVDLKHAKSLALAMRLRRAQQLPPGWTSHVDAQGRRYLRQEETGLTSWTLPRHLI